jgi:hypothetical protein
MVAEEVVFQMAREEPDLSRDTWSERGRQRRRDVGRE